MINVSASVINILYVKNIHLEPAICSCENGKYLASIINNLVIMCDEIIHTEGKSFYKESKKTTTNFNFKEAIFIAKNV